MLEVSNVKVYDLEESVIASRNAMRLTPPEYTKDEFEASLKRAIQLANTKNGSGHKTFLSGIRVSFDLKYPGYISPELQRYHWVDIVTSSSKMHRLLKMDLNTACNKYVSMRTIVNLQELINEYNQLSNSDVTIKKFYTRGGKEEIIKGKNNILYYQWMRIISDCPQGLELFMRVSTNYLQLQNIYHQRKHHRLIDDWQVGFCKNFVENLPYANEFIIGLNNDGEREED